MYIHIYIYIYIIYIYIYILCILYASEGNANTIATMHKISWGECLCIILKVTLSIDWDILTDARE